MLCKQKKQLLFLDLLLSSFSFFMKASVLRFSIQLEFIIVLCNLSETSGCSFYRDFQGRICVPMHMNVAYCWKGFVLIAHIDGI